jgi:hypothetical protein
LVVRIVNATDTAGLVQARIEGLLVLQCRLTVAEPGENLVVKRIDYFDFVIVSVCHRYHILVWNEANAKRVLQFRNVGLAILITVSMKIFWVFISSN